MKKHVKVLGKEYVVMDATEYNKMLIELDWRIKFVGDAFEKIENWRATGLPDEDLLAKKWQETQIKTLQECLDIIFRYKP